jgi:molybdate transport system substrate-binding protein
MGRRVCLWVIGVAVASVLLAGCGGEPAGESPLRCYVGGTMRPAMEELAKAWEAQGGCRIELDFGDSGAGLIKAETTGRGDLYVAHDPFHAAVERKGLSQGGWVCATLEPVIAVPKGNPKGIHGLRDLGRPGQRLVLTDATYSTAGHLVTLMLKRAGVTEAVEKNVVSRTRMGGEAANAVILGHADAAIAWNAVVRLRSDRLDAVPIEPELLPQPGVDAVTSPTFGHIDMGAIKVTIDVLKSSVRPALAREFAEYCASQEAREVWQRLGYSPPPPGPRALGGDAAPAAGGPEKPRAAIFLYVGAGLKPAMDELAEAFRAKTAARVECDYGGSGMLVSRLRLSQRGDVFMPGERWYVNMAAEDGLVASQKDVCYFIPTILVQKGNPKQIKTLADLVRPGIRLGLGNPKACQVGRASEQIFAKNGIAKEAVAKNVVFQSVTVNELGIQVTMGQLDAAIVWDATAAYYAEKAGAVAIPLPQNEVCNVTAAVLKCSAQPAAARAFVDFLVSPDGQAIFRKHQYATEPPK